MFGRNGESPVPVIAPRSPADCFDIALEAVRIATGYRTPVVLLSDGYLANGSEPWQIPDVATLPDLHVTFASSPATPDGRSDGTGHAGGIVGASGGQGELGVDAGVPFRPYDRDPVTLARPWAVPGTPGLEHRIGGIEKADGTGEISYDPDNHDLMTRLRQAKVDGVTVPDLEIDDPDGDAAVLVLGWGSTYGPIAAGARLAREAGTPVAVAHLRHLNPLPANTGAVLRAYRRVLVPEMNLGQLALLLRARYLVDVRGYNRVRGLPFTSSEIAEAVLTLAKEEDL
jgi:2-oxoglutarate ferredoxin oxidoreductase subunit alpha